MVKCQLQLILTELLSSLSESECDDMGGIYECPSDPRINECFASEPGLSYEKKLTMKNLR